MSVPFKVPAGWQLVPIKPTPEMVKAGDQKTWVLPSHHCWAAMLAAAPTFAMDMPAGSLNGVPHVYTQDEDGTWRIVPIHPIPSQGVQP